MNSGISWNTSILIKILEINWNRDIINEILFLLQLCVNGRKKLKKLKCENVSLELTRTGLSTEAGNFCDINTLKPGNPKKNLKKEVRNFCVRNKLKPDALGRVKREGHETKPEGKIWVRSEGSRDITNCVTHLVTEMSSEEPSGMWLLKGNCKNTWM